MKTKLIALLMLSSVFALFTGCNTTKGVGQDMERAGEKIQDAAK